MSFAAMPSILHMLARLGTRLYFEVWVLASIRRASQPGSTVWVRLYLLQAKQSIYMLPTKALTTR